MNIDEDLKTWITERLTDSEFVIHFTKKDGTKRKMRCTLTEGYIPKPEKKDPLTQKKVRAVNEEVKVVWDMDKEQWRSFRWDSVYDAYRFPLGNGEDAQV